MYYSLACPSSNSYRYASTAAVTLSLFARAFSSDADAAFKRIEDEMPLPPADHHQDHFQPDIEGFDGSVLLHSTYTIDSEKNARPNKGSLRGFEVIDQIKSAIDKACGGPVVSCADILAVAARDSVVALGGPSWAVPLGRRDSTTASKLPAGANLPSPIMDLPALINTFNKQGLDMKDLVVFSGGHTLGFGRCATFKNRIYNETNIDSE